MNILKLKDRPIAITDDIIIPVQYSTGEYWLKISFQKIKEFLSVSEIEAPEDSVDIYITEENPIFPVLSEIENNIKVHNSYSGGIISLNPLESSQSCTFYFMSDNVNAKINVYDESDSLLVSYPAEKKDIFSCIFTLETGWTVEQIKSDKLLSDIYSYNPVSGVTNIKAPWMFQLLSNNVNLLGTTQEGNLRNFALTEFYRTKKIVQEIDITEENYSLNITNNMSDVIEVTNNFPASVDGEMTITFNDVIEGREFLFSVKNSTTKKLNLKISSTIHSLLNTTLLNMVDTQKHRFRVIIFKNDAILVNY